MGSGIKGRGLGMRALGSGFRVLGFRDSGWIVKYGIREEFDFIDWGSGMRA